MKFFFLKNHKHVYLHLKTKSSRCICFFLKALSYQVKLQSHQFLLTEIVFDYFVDIFSH